MQFLLFHAQGLFFLRYQSFVISQRASLTQYFSNMTTTSHFTKNHADSSTAGDWPSSILVVEDEPNFLHLMRDSLLLLGITPTLAKDGKEAIEILTTDSFPLVLTDMNMPHINGMQLIAHIKSHYPETDVIVMTGFAKDFGLIEVIRAGATDYLTKPFSLEELKAKIIRVTRERALLQFFQHKMAKQRHARQGLSQDNNALLEQVQRQKEELSETNAALRILLRQRDMENNDLSQTMTNRFLTEIMPLIEKLQKSGLEEVQQHYLDAITMNLENIFLPASRHKTFKHKPFTKMEIKIINLMKQQKTSKDIASILQVSPGTIRTHRENIRKKLQITNTKKNLYKTIISIP